MLFRETKIAGVYVIDLEPHVDERGFLARVWCEQQFVARGLTARLAQCSLSYNTRKGTLRGMHYQGAPRSEAKLVRCLKGSIYDVALDLRPLSSTFRSWISVELTGENRRGFFIPEGVAHGFQTLADDTEVLYLISEFYDPAHACGVRWDDQAFGITWPLPVSQISQRDRSFPDFRI